MLNKVIIEGRLTADPELRQTPSGVEAVPAFQPSDAVTFEDVTADENLPF